MPANKNAVTRYFILDCLLANPYGNYTTEDLQQRVSDKLSEMYDKPVKVSLRTIQYDLDYLENGPFKANIEHYAYIDHSPNSPDKNITKNCHRYKDRTFTIFQQKLTDEEKHLLGEAFTLLGQFDGLPNLEGLERLRESLNVKTDRQIVSFTKNPLEGKNLLGELFTAISQKHVVKIHFHRFDTPEVERSIVVHPYMLKEYNRRWYLIAAAEETEKILNFALDRMDSVEMPPNHHYVEYKGDLNERFEDIIGVTLNEGYELQTIVFWVSDRSCEYVKTKPLHESQHDIKGEREAALRDKFPMLEGGRFFYIECIENYELLRELTSFRAELIVLSPEEIKQKVFDIVKEMCNKYDLLCK